MSVRRDRTYAAIWEADLAASVFVKALFALRAIPSLFARSHRAAPIPRSRDAARSSPTGFFLLAEDRGREVVVGVMGRFLEADRQSLPGDRQRFLAPPSPGTARAAWNFAVPEQPQGRSLLTTETRVLCADEAALRSFRRYWRVVGPFSGLIRRYMLASIRATAQAA